MEWTTKYVWSVFDYVCSPAIPPHRILLFGPQWSRSLSTHYRMNFSTFLCFFFIVFGYVREYSSLMFFLVLFAFILS